MRHVASLRPEIPILGVTDAQSTYSQLALVWGARAYLIKNPKAAHSEVIGLLKSEGFIQKDDVIVRTSGSQAGVTGTTNTIIVERIS